MDNSPLLPEPPLELTLRALSMRALPRLRFVLILFAVVTAGCGPRSQVAQVESTLHLPCRAAPGAACCAADSEVPTRHCGGGAGCNVATGRCEACGGPGQPCCDGALTGFSGKCYSSVLDPRACESCFEGSTCDARMAAGGEWVGSRVCLACGTTLGKACCAPDVRYALYRCTRDTTTRHRLDCADAFVGGVCVECGALEQVPCGQETRKCDAGLTPVGGRCVPCGALGQPSCEGDCQNGLVDRNGICAPPCGRMGQGCCGAGGCRDNFTVCSAGLCVHAGSEGEPCLIGAHCNAAKDGFPLTCHDGGCQRLLHTKGICDSCQFDDQCTDPWDGFSPVCWRNQCILREDHSDFVHPPDLCHPKPDPCAGKVCPPGDRCFEGSCRSCGYPDGECCNGPIFGGCYGGGLLQCGWDNRCH